MSELYNQARVMLRSKTKVLIVSHRKPDADTLGAAIAIKMFLHDEHIKADLACIDDTLEKHSFLPEIEKFRDEFDLKEYDLMVVVDAGASYMTNFHLKYEDFFNSGLPIINIDHHASNDNFGDLNIVEPGSASTTLIIFKMFESWNFPLSSDIATCLLAGIYHDTGSFMHSNTSEEVLEIAGKLLEVGARIGDISKYLFKTTEVSTLKLWGKVMENARVTEDDVVLSVIKEEDYEDTDAEPEQLSGAVDYLNMVPTGKYAILVNEDRNGNVKGSFRTRRDDIDLSRIAAVFGGGGHPKASGFNVPGKLESEVSYKIVGEGMSKKILKF